MSFGDEKKPERDTDPVPAITEPQASEILSALADIKSEIKDARLASANGIVSVREVLREDLRAAFELIRGDIAGTRQELSDRLGKNENATWAVNQSLESMKAAFFRLAEMFSGTHELAATALKEAEEAKAIASGHHSSNGNGASAEE